MKKQKHRVLQRTIKQPKVDPIKAMLASPSRVITTRIAKGLDQWLNDYVHKMYPTPITKKALLEEALVMLIRKKGLTK